MTPLKNDKYYIKFAIILWLRFQHYVCLFGFYYCHQSDQTLVIAFKINMNAELLY